MTDKIQDKNLDQKPKHPGGRPPKTFDELPKNWKERMLELSSEGAGDVELRVDALGGLSKKVWYRWLEEEEEFMEIYSQCKDRCALWWQRCGRNLWDKDMNDRLWYRNMVNRFKWNDNQVVTQNQNLNVKVDEKIENIKDRIEDLTK